MNNNVKKQVLIESFEIIKDCGSSKRKALTRCISNMEEYDGDIAMNMWQYILQSNIEELHYDDSFVSDLLREFRDKIKNSFESFWEGITIRLTPLIIKNDILLDIIFGQTKNCGNIYETPYCIAGIILNDRPDIVYRVIDLMNNNPYIEEECSISQLLCEAYDIILNNITNQEISNATKEALLSGIQLLKDKKERAECNIYFSSL